METTPSTSQSSIIQIEGLTKSFGNNQALRGIDLDVKHGESIAVFGPNGAGKTTLIRVLATVINPSSGRVIIDGLDLKKKADDIRRKIGVVTHQTFLYSNLTAYENLEFYGRLFDVTDRKERICEVVDIMGMTPHLHDRIGTLSHGMQQRLSIARSLLHRPVIMLLDEPETGLDQQAMSLLWNILKTEQGSRPSVIVTTHNLEQGLELGDRFVILNKGKIVYENSKQSLNLDGLKEVYEQSTRDQQ